MVRSAFGDEIEIGPDAIAAGLEREREGERGEGGEKQSKKKKRRKWHGVKPDFCYLVDLRDCRLVQPIGTLEHQAVDRDRLMFQLNVDVVKTTR